MFINFEFECKLCGIHTKGGAVFDWIELNWIILFSLFEIKNIWKNVVKTCYLDLFIDGFVKFLELLQMFNKEL